MTEIVSDLDVFYHVERNTLARRLCESPSRVLGIDLIAAWQLVVHSVDELCGLDQGPGYHSSIVYRLPSGGYD